MAAPLPQGTGYSWFRFDLGGPGPASDTTVGLGWTPEAAVSTWPDQHTRIVSAISTLSAAALVGPWRLKAVKSVYQSGSLGTPPLEIESAVNVTGAAAAQPMPANCALLITKITGVGGRRNKGRIYFPGCLPAVDVGPGGAITPAVVGFRQIQFSAFYANLMASSGVPGSAVQPAVTHSAFPAPGQSNESVPVLGFIVQPVIATQRRRMR